MYYKSNLNQKFNNKFTQTNVKTKMKTTFAAAAVAGLVVAKVPLGKLKNNPAFVRFISENNRNYRSIHEINMRA